MRKKVKSSISDNNILSDWQFSLAYRAQNDEPLLEQPQLLPTYM